MKSAMQELIELFETELKRDNLSNDEGYVTKWAIFNAKQLLKKEKEQSITDYSNGFLNGLGYKKEDKNIMYGVIMQSKAEGDIYYNETYIEKDKELPRNSKTLLEIINLENEKNIINDILNKSDKHE